MITTITTRAIAVDMTTVMEDEGHQAGGGRGTSSDSGMGTRTTGIGSMAVDFKTCRVGITTRVEDEEHQAGGGGTPLDSRTRHQGTRGRGAMTARIMRRTLGMRMLYAKGGSPGRAYCYPKYFHFSPTKYPHSFRNGRPPSRLVFVGAARPATRAVLAARTRQHRP